MVVLSAPLSTPSPVVALPWGSRSMSRVGRSARARPAARFTAVVVLPTPPFWLTTAMTLGISIRPATHRNVPRATIYTLLMLISEPQFHVQHFPRRPLIPQRPLKGQTFPESRG